MSILIGSQMKVEFSVIKKGFVAVLLVFWFSFGSFEGANV